MFLLEVGLIVNSLNKLLSQRKDSVYQNKITGV